MFPEVEVARHASTGSVLLTSFSEVFHNVALEYGRQPLIYRIIKDYLEVYFKIRHTDIIIYYSYIL